jgi:hypothetical protein
MSDVNVGGAHPPRTVSHISRVLDESLYDYEGSTMVYVKASFGTREK